MHRQRHPVLHSNMLCISQQFSQQLQRAHLKAHNSINNYWLQEQYSTVWKKASSFSFYASVHLFLCSSLTHTHALAINIWQHSAKKAMVSWIKNEVASIIFLCTGDSFNTQVCGFGSCLIGFFSTSTPDHCHTKWQTNPFRCVGEKKNYNIYLQNALLLWYCWSSTPEY